VFSDVVDEFCSIRGVASRFENWRNTDFDAYQKAFVSSSLPKVLGPLVRLKMLMWNPLQVSSVTEFVDEIFMALNIWIVVFFVNTES
jgi:GC-rich sequence DNA-binding factor